MTVDTGNGLAQIIGRFSTQYIEQYQPNSFIIRTLDALQKCRTPALGGHIERCDCCGHERTSYNSCRNRHCPKCQGLAREKWLEQRQGELLPTSYFHVVFTLPEPIAAIAFYNKETVYE